MNGPLGFALADDNSYREALERRRQLLDELRLVEDYIALHEKLFRPQERDLFRTAAGAMGGEQQRRRERNVLPPRRLAQMAREILLERGHPMTRSELTEAIQARGVPLVGRDKTKNVGTILWRFRDQFVNLEGRGYWPRDVANPDVGYEPPARGETR